MLHGLGVLFYIAAAVCLILVFRAMSGYSADPMMALFFGSGIVANLFFGAICHAVDEIKDDVRKMRESAVPSVAGSTHVETY